jgi:hypothetical protein
MEDHMPKSPQVPFWQRLRNAAAKFYAVLRHAATVISIAFASFKAWQFVTWWFNQSA